jgi:TetR/AcrR family transcriptional regulator, cholesterol catabolism regulator
LPAPRQASRSISIGRDGGEPRTSSRSKRAMILEIATAYFGEHGYEDTKWADVASAVGIGSTALYHYFESKLHCLYVIMADALDSFAGDFERITNEHDDLLEALVLVLRSGYDLTDQEVLRNRVLVAEQGLVGIQRQSRREEEARVLARARTRDLEFAWATFLVRGMEQGHIPAADARLLTRAVLGLYNSIWHWYRPRGTLSLEDVADFYIGRQLALLSLPPELADRPAEPGDRKSKQRKARTRKAA